MDEPNETPKKKRGYDELSLWGVWIVMMILTYLPPDKVCLRGNFFVVWGSIVLPLAATVTGYVQKLRSEKPEGSLLYIPLGLVTIGWLLVFGFFRVFEQGMCHHSCC